MKYKFSRCLAMEHSNSKELIEFYRDKIGLDMVDNDGGDVEFDTKPVRLFVNQAEKQALIFELLVDDLDKAKEDLASKGCKILQWEGKGKTCYARDPFGFIFNVWEDPAAFDN